MALTLTNKQLARFKKICRDRMGIELNDARARDQALKLLHLIALTKNLPITNKTYEPNKK